MHDGLSWWMMWGGVWMLIFWGAILALVIWLAQRTELRGHGGRQSSAMDIARERHARREISAEELDEFRRDLS